MTNCDHIKPSDIKTCEALLEVIELALKNTNQRTRCRFGRHDWGDWQQDRHPRSIERGEAFCPLLHWPMIYRACRECGAAEWSHQPH